MRGDFARLLVERPRFDDGRLRKGRPPRDTQPLPRVQGLRRAIAERGWGKSLSENLAPLRRYLDKQVGRPWNRVHSEIRAGVKPGHPVQEHVMLHAREFVHERVDVVPPSAGAPCGLRTRPGRGWGRDRALRPGDLYVDPVSGLLRKARRRLKGPPA